MNRVIWIVLLVFSAISSIGQNLVNNPSFEAVNEITNRWAGTHSHFNRWIKEWDSPTQGSPDILYVGSLSRMFPKRPKVDLSGYKPRTGEFMIGIKTYGCENNTLHCKEYIQTKLRKPLETGKKYYFEYWIQPIEPSVMVNSFGIAFISERMEELMQTGVIDVYPVMMTDTITNLVETQWTRISGVFTAYEALEYAIIGNFGPDKSIAFKADPNGIDYGYYLLDDVIIKPYHESYQSQIKLDEPIVLENVLFKFDQAIIQDSSKFLLDEIAEFLLSDTTNVFEIHGHTDSEGTEEYNQVLSLKRANAIKDYFIENGVNPKRLKAIGFGSDQPRYEDASEKQRKFNRRVEIKIIPRFE